MAESRWSTTVLQHGSARETRPLGAAPSRPVPTICRFHGIVIAMYYDDHGHPHFHARHAGSQAKIRFDQVDSSKAAWVFGSCGWCWRGRSCIAKSFSRTGGGLGRVRHCSISTRFNDRTHA
jgi:hypothetical protein